MVKNTTLSLAKLLKTKKLKLVFVSILVIINFHKVCSQNIGINGSGASAHPSALLDVDAVSSPSLGILIPRIALQAINVSNPVSGPATSLLVYNTASASSGTNAVSPGYYYWDGVKWVRFQYASSGSSSLDWSLVGNAGTVDGTNFIGTIDNVPFNIRVNNQKAGRIDPMLYNTAYGYQSSNAITTGTYNVSIGEQALLSNTSGGFNTAVGYRSMFSSTTSNANTAIGMQALYSNIIGNNNTAIGRGTLFYNTANDNTASGNYALYSNTSGANNTAHGSQALYSNTTGSLNVAIGSSSMLNATGTGNVGVGYYTLANTTGVSNIGIGNYALSSNTSGYSNAALGTIALNKNSTGHENTAVGTDALHENTIASYNTAVGARSSYSNTTGEYNVAVGIESLYSNSTGSLNTSVGANSLRNNTTGRFNTAIGYESLISNTLGESNVAVGYAGRNITTGNRNVAMGFAVLGTQTSNENIGIGYNTLGSAFTGVGNISMGSNNMNSLTTGNSNIAIGGSLLGVNNTGGGNIAFGNIHLIKNTTGTGNVAIGYYNLNENITGSSNFAVGSESLRDANGDNNISMGTWTMRLIKGASNNNIAIGARAGDNLTGTVTAISGNVLIGAVAGDNVQGNNNIAIGIGTSFVNAVSNNQLNIGNVIYGQGLTGGGNGNVNIGYPSVTHHKLNVITPNTDDGIYLSGANNGGEISWHDNSHFNLTTGRTTIGTISMPHYGMAYPQTPTSAEMWLSGYGGLLFITNGAERMFVNSIGNVGIATSSPLDKLTVNGNTGVFGVYNYRGGANANVMFGTAGHWVVSEDATSNLLLRTYSSRYYDINGATFQQNGYVGIGTTTPSYNFHLIGTSYVAGKSIAERAGAANPMFEARKTDAGAGSMMTFLTNGSITGEIATSGVSTSYNTTSDVRLKENIKLTSKGLEDVLKIAVKDYNYKADESKNLETGFIAQELVDIYPQAVQKGGEDVKTNPWMIDYSKITPLLVKAIQELNEKNEKLEKEIELLKSKK